MTHGGWGIHRHDDDSTPAPGRGWAKRSRSMLLRGRGRLQQTIEILVELR
jgi:hypothetical protein